MANFKYFADTENGTLEFNDVSYKRDGAAYGYDHESGQWVKVSRKVIFKNSPSLHKCDVRCTTAKGRVMQCECACGGKNHGKAA